MPTKNTIYKKVYLGKKPYVVSIYKPFYSCLKDVKVNVIICFCKNICKKLSF